MVEQRILSDGKIKARKLYVGFIVFLMPLIALLVKSFIPERYVNITLAILLTVMSVITLLYLVANILAARKFNKKYRSRYIPKDVKKYVWERDQGRCVNCGSMEGLQFDHVIPFSRGGANTRNNIQLLCEECNKTKGNEIGFC